MLLESFQFNQPGFEGYMTDTGNALAGILYGIGETIAVNAKETVGRQWPVGTANPPPGPPYRRSGDMQASIRATAPRATAFGMEVDVIVNAAHRGFNYPQWLLIQGYRLVDTSFLTSLA